MGSVSNPAMAGMPWGGALVTHDLYEAAALADRLVVVERGELLQEGVPADVLGAPASDRVRNALDLPTVS